MQHKPGNVVWLSTGIGGVIVAELSQEQLSAVREAMLASPDMQDLMSTSITQRNDQLRPILSDLNRTAEAWAPFRETMNRQLLETAQALMPAQGRLKEQIAGIAKVVVPFPEDLQRQLAETARTLMPIHQDLQRQLIDVSELVRPIQGMHLELAKSAKLLTPITEGLRRQMQDIASPLSEDLRQRLAELADFIIPMSEEVQRHATALAESVGLNPDTFAVPADLAETIKSAALNVATARPRTPGEITAFLALLTAIVTFLTVVVQLVKDVTEAQGKGDSGGTVNQVFNNPTSVTKNTTIVVQQPASDTPTRTR